jgi:hypothetical protein
MTRFTEADLIERLYRRYHLPHYLAADHVRIDWAGNSPREADFIAFDTSRADGYAVIAFEVKISRSDWLRELANPRKHQFWGDIHGVNDWWLVAPRDVVRDDDFKTRGFTDWGWLVPAGHGLRQARHTAWHRIPGDYSNHIVQAADTRAHQPVTKTLIANLIHAASRPRLGQVTPR